MNYYRLNVFCILQKDIKYRDLFNELSNALNCVICKDAYLEKFHNTNTFKMYSFSGLNPVDKTGYKNGSMYSFEIRFIDKNTALKVKELLMTHDNDVFDVFDIVFSEVQTRAIDVLYSITPAISVIDSKDHWIKDNHSLDTLTANINNNAMKKYQLIYNESIDRDHDFIEEITQINDKVIIFPYKGGVLLTNKFRLRIKKDAVSQKLAQMIYVTGLLEKNALGFGFVETDGSDTFA